MCKRGLWRIAQQGFLTSAVIFGLIVYSNQGNLIREPQDSSSPREAALATLSLRPDEVVALRRKANALS